MRYCLSHPLSSTALTKLMQKTAASHLADIWACNGGSNQNFTLTSSGQITSGRGPTGQAPRCLRAYTAKACTNVWGRKLSGGDFALGFVNNGATGVNVTCDATCFQALFKGSPSPTTALKVRDLWKHQDVGFVGPAAFSYTAFVDGDGSASVVRLSPQAV